MVRETATMRLHCVTTTDVSGCPCTAGASFSTGTSLTCAMRITSPAQAGPAHGRPSEASVVDSTASAGEVCTAWRETAHPCESEAAMMTARHDISRFILETLKCTEIVLLTI